MCRLRYDKIGLLDDGVNIDGHPVLEIDSIIRPRAREELRESRHRCSLAGRAECPLEEDINTVRAGRLAPHLLDCLNNVARFLYCLDFSSDEVRGISAPEVAQIAVVAPGEYSEEIGLSDWSRLVVRLVRDVLG